MHIMTSRIHMRSSNTRLAPAIPRVIASLPSGWALFGERQFVRGYVLLLPDPVVPDINSLGEPERAQFLLDMTRVGDALLAVAGALRIKLCDLR